MNKLTEYDFESYLTCLRNIVQFPTLFNRPDQIETSMSWCQDFLTEHLKDYNIYRDQKRNLIACPLNIDLERDIIYLSAHLDTVDANPLEWDEPFFPFTLDEDKTQMFARGVSDCKAGVAFELFLAKLLSTQKITLSNLIFTITFKEEGAGDESGFAVIPSQIFKHHTNVPVMHYLVLSNRSFATNADIYAQLDGIIYEEVKDFSISQGMNFDQIFSKHSLSGILNTYQKNKLRTQQPHNVGASDATIVTRGMNPKHKQRFYPIVMGPGARSQRDKMPPRPPMERMKPLTSKAAVECLLSVLTTLGTIKPDLRI